jgi:hypothetical protein
VKHTERKLTNQIVDKVERWFTGSQSGVKWSNFLSHFFALAAGIGQGRVLSSVLFSLYIDIA